MSLWLWWSGRMASGMDAALVTAGNRLDVRTEKRYSILCGGSSLKPGGIVFVPA